MRVKCKVYAERKIRLLNKRRKLNKHLRNNPNDKDAVNALKLAA